MFFLTFCGIQNTFGLQTVHAETDSETTLTEEWIDDDEGWIDDEEEWTDDEEQDSDDSEEWMVDEEWNAEEKANSGVVKTESYTAKSASAYSARTSNKQAGSQSNRVYKTGIGIGNDIFLILSAITGLAALFLVVRKVRDFV